MILIPIGHEQDGTRRLPWITFGVMVLCVVAFLLTGFGGTRYENEAGEALEEAIAFWMEHPYLSLDPTVERQMHGLARQDTVEAFREGIRTFTEKPDDQATIAVEQSELDLLCRKALQETPDHPFRRWGLVPARVSPVALVTHMFLHAGWLHLIGNLLILYLAGPFIEDVWGRPLFAAFYAVSGIVAALCFVIPHARLDAPLIGASGAIAGVMGAFAVRYAATRVQFFYLVGFAFRGTFWAPAWFMLGLWVAQQVFMALLTSGSTGESGDGVAYLAHIGGFAFGAGVAFAMRRAGVEQKYLAPSLEAKSSTTVVANADTDEALALADAGNLDEAFKRLADLAAQRPSDVDTALAWWSVALKIDRAKEAAPAMARAVLDELRRGQTDLALDHWEELKAHAPRVALDPLAAIRLATALAHKSRRSDAVEALRRALLAAGPTPTAALALKIAVAADGIAPDIARAAARIALERPDLDPAQHSRAEALIERAAGSTVSVASDPPM